MPSSCADNKILLVSLPHFGFNGESKHRFEMANNEIESARQIASDLGARDADAASKRLAEEFQQFDNSGSTMQALGRDQNYFRAVDKELKDLGFPPLALDSSAGKNVAFSDLNGNGMRDKEDLQLDLTGSTYEAFYTSRGGVQTGLNEAAQASRSGQPAETKTSQSAPDLASPSTAHAAETTTHQEPGAKIELKSQLPHPDSSASAPAKQSSDGSHAIADGVKQQGNFFAINGTINAERQASVYDKGPQMLHAGAEQFTGSANVAARGTERTENFKPLFGHATIGDPQNNTQIEWQLTAPVANGAAVVKDLNFPTVRDGQKAVNEPSHIEGHYFKSQDGSYQFSGTIQNSIVGKKPFLIDLHPKR
jgi:hypothetical protein